MKEKKHTGNQSKTQVLLFDILLSGISSVIAILLIRWYTHAFNDFMNYLGLWALLSAVATFLSLKICGTHKIVIRYSSYRSIGKLAAATFMKEGLLTLTLVFGLFEFLNTSMEVALILTDYLMTLVMFIMARVFVIVYTERMQSSYENDVARMVVMVYGISDKSVAMVTRLERSRHYMVAGFLSREKNDAGKIVQDRRVYYFDNEEDIERMKMNIGFSCVIFARDNDAENEQDRLVRYCLHRGIHMLVTPKVEEVDFGGLDQHAIKEVIDNDFIPDGMSPFERNTKRAFDFLLSSLLLLVFAIPMGLCALAVKLWGGEGPVIFKQERIGRFGRPFHIYKFRTMRADAEAAGPALFAGDNDPRLTKVGKFLREHHLDEMPQLFNVWRGDMAFIGYRPERKFYIDQIMERDPRYFYLYQIRPGVTSYATLKNGYTDSMEKMMKRLEYDLYYLRHRSWFFDAKVLWSTFRNIVFGKKF